MESLECWLLIGSWLVVIVANIQPLFQQWGFLVPQPSMTLLGSSCGPQQKRMLAVLLFFSYELWFVGYVSSASLWRDTDEIPFHWNSWQPWVCMCDLHKQARIRHFVVWGANVSLNMKVNEFWQERACSLEDCDTCTPQECPGQSQRFSFFPRFQKLLLPPKPPILKIPLPPRLGIPSYENLPVLDYAGEN